jgi:hypothetical protein
MPPCRNPRAADGRGKHVIELESEDRRASAGRSTKNSRSIIAPRKVVRPGLAPRIKERNDRASRRVDGFGLDALGVIAQPAGKIEVLFNSASALCRGNRVLDFQRSINQMLWAQAIAATIAGKGANGTAKFLGDVPVTHGGRLLCGRGSQPAANRLGNGLGFPQQAFLINLH